MSRLDLVVGPNGAGKSTFVDLTLSAALPPGTPFVNADLIAASRWPDDPQDRSYDAAAVAAATRDRLLELGEPFVAETVFSHPSKVDLVRRARAAGYYVALHVLLIPVDLCVARVEVRVQAGGHAVPEEKIRARYDRLWEHVVQAAALASRATVYDNTASTGPRMVAALVEGQPVLQPSWPAWTPDALLPLTAT